MNAVDTNILIYACDNLAGARHETAIALLNQLDDAVIPWQVACEFISASGKLRNRGFTPNDAWAVLANWLQVFRLVLPEPPMLDRARNLHLSDGVAFWDAMIYAACLETRVARIYSEDLPGKLFPELEVVNPFA